MSCFEATKINVGKINAEEYYINGKKTEFQNMTGADITILTTKIIIFIKFQKAVFYL